MPPVPVIDWTPVDRELPPFGSAVEVITVSGYQCRVIFDRNLWWLPDRSMYCYIDVRFWRLADGHRAETRRRR